AVVGSHAVEEVRAIKGFAMFQHLTKDKGLAVAGEGQAHAVDIGGSPDGAFGDTAQDGTFFRAGGDDAECAFGFVVAVVADPFLAQDEAAKAVGPFGGIAAEAVAVVVPIR